jgi:hypothetical protein
MGYNERTHRGSEAFSHVRFASTDVVQGEVSRNAMQKRFRGILLTPFQFPTPFLFDRKQNTITYLHALRPGVNRESHGLTVAALAGMPASALQVARETLRSLSVQDEDEGEGGRKVGGRGEAR